MINSFTKKHCPRLYVVVYKHVCCWFSFCWLNNLCIQSRVHIALTTCELHCPMCPHYNVWPGAICCCLRLIKLVKYVQSLHIMDMYVLEKFHHFMLFGFWVTRLGGGGEGGGEDEQNSIIAPYTYDGRHHANPYILSTTVLSAHRRRLGENAFI